MSNNTQPRWTAKEVASRLEKAGFKRVRTSGSHQIYRNAAGTRATVPMHAGKILHPKIIKTIIKETGIS